MPIKTIVFSFATLFLLSACNNDKAGADTASKPADSSATTPATTANASTADKAERASINLALSGGDMAGSYSAICRDACCSWGIAGDNVFGNQYSETGKGPKELSSVQLIVDDVKQGNKSTNEFTLTVSFGELFGKDSKSFNIDTRKGKKEGSGKLDLQYEGEKAVVTIKGTSKEGPAIDLKMECRKVTTAANLGQ
jgi:hypothetical protein